MTCGSVGRPCGGGCRECSARVRGASNEGMARRPCGGLLARGVPDQRECHDFREVRIASPKRSVRRGWESPQEPSDLRASAPRCFAEHLSSRAYTMTDPDDGNIGGRPRNSNRASAVPSSLPKSKMST